MQIVTPALVLREVKVGEADRILLLLTPEQGLISASAKGSLRLKSRLFSGCGLFCYSEFTLYEGRTMYRVDEAQVKNTFFGLRESVEGMALAMYLAELTAALAPTGKEAQVLLRLLLNSLYLLSETNGRWARSRRCLNCVPSAKRAISRSFFAAASAENMRAAPFIWTRRREACFAAIAQRRRAEPRTWTRHR